MPGHEVVVIDDNSTDLATIEVLRGLESRMTVLTNTSGELTERKTGGLAAGMNRAMRWASSKGWEYVLFIQDDMQMVRRFRPEDPALIGAYFRNVPNAIQLSVSFVRQLSAPDFFNAYRIDKPAAAYLRQEGVERGKSNFSDTGVFSVSRFNDLFGAFEAGEGNNSAKARARGLTCGRAIYPLMCWLPYPTSYRGKARDMQHRFFERFGRAGFYPIKMMTEKEEEAFLKRDPTVLPIMETYLRAPAAPRHDVWSTGGGEYNFLAYDGMLVRPYRAVQRVKRMLEGRQ